MARTVRNAGADIFWESGTPCGFREAHLDAQTDWRRCPTTNANCESHRFCVAEASHSQEYVVHEGIYKVYSAKMMDR